MKGILLKCILALAVVFLASQGVFAAASKTINVTASVPTISSGLNVAVSRINASSGNWEQTSPSIPIDFQTLQLDNDNHIFTSAYYYAVDIGVNDNTGSAWTITHATSPIRRDATNELDDNVNVSFVKQLSDTDSVNLQKVSFSNSHNVTYGKAQLANGWLRIYYGIGTGKDDAPGVSPIGMDKPAGTYSGSVLITLTP